MDFDRKMKTETLWAMSDLTEKLKQKLAVLRAIDRDTTTSSAYDLTDQLVTMTAKIGDLLECIERAKNVNGE